MFISSGVGSCEDACGMSHAASKATVCTPPIAPKEVRYPFGVQNDLGQVILSPKAKVSCTLASRITLLF